MSENWLEGSRLAPLIAQAESVALTGGLLNRRQIAISKLQNEGLPKRKNEYWRYTPLKILTDKSLAPTAKSLAPQNFDISLKKNLPMNSFQFFSGKPKMASGHKSSLQALPSDAPVARTLLGAQMDDFFEVTPQSSYRIDHLGQNAKDSQLLIDFFPEETASQLNMSLNQSHLQIHLDGEKECVLRVHGGSGVFTQHRIDIFVKKSSQVRMLNLLVGAPEAFTRLQVNYHLEEGSQLDSWSYLLGGKVVRLEQAARLANSNCLLNLFGGSLAAPGEHLENQTYLEHAIGGCTTDQLFKNVCGKDSTTVVGGTVKICKGSEFASSGQLNQSLLLEKNANAISLPRLLIDNDNVKATHGSTTGQLNPDEVFYLQSRGTTRAEAERLLAKAFLWSTFETLPETMKPYAQSILQSGVDKLLAGTGFTSQVTKSQEGAH